MVNINVPNNEKPDIARKMIDQSLPVDCRTLPVSDTAKLAKKFNIGTSVQFLRCS